MERKKRPAKAFRAREEREVPEHCCGQGDTLGPAVASTYGFIGWEATSGR